LNSCIVDEAVDLAPQREGACGVAKHLFGVGDVCDTCFQRTGARAGSQTRYLALLPGYRKDVGALRNQALDDGDAQVACGAGMMMFFPENSMDVLLFEFEPMA
jgi:hypothetical protein